MKTDPDPQNTVLGFIQTVYTYAIHIAPINRFHTNLVHAFGVGVTQYGS